MTDEQTPEVAEEISDPAISSDREISDAELVALALAADPEASFDEDAVPLSLYPTQYSLTPQWYMPPALAFGHNRWRTALVIALVAAFLLIEVSGLCSTFGQLVPA